MVNNISNLIPYVVLLSHVVLVVVVLSIFFRNSWGKRVESFIGEHAVTIAFAVSLLPVIGSLFYSQIVGFEPCVLCWWQRVFLFPLPIILGVSVWKRDKYVFKYVIPLVTISAIIALYQSYTSLGGASLLPCTAVGGACAKVYVKALGYITIPSMSLTISIYILIISWIKRAYDKNRNA